MKKLLLSLTTLLFILSVAYFVLRIFLPQEKLDKQTPSKQSTSAASKKVTVKPLPQPSLQSIFATHSLPSDLDQSKIVTLIATGDVIPARGANWPAVTSGNFNYNWEKTADYLKTGDITLVNLEAPLLKNCKLASSGFTFCGDSRQVQGMSYAGVDVANLANNHISNFGWTGVTETEKLLDTTNILWTGFSHLAIKEVKGLRFGFLGYNGVGETIDRENLKIEVSESKRKVDVLIVSIHWGKEYELLPMKDGNIAPDNPGEIGHLLIDSGADLVVGNHPHWVQGIEFYPNKIGEKKLITYAHGNFIFDQTWSVETQEGVVGSYTFFGKKLVDVSFKPIVVDKSYQPVFVTGERADKILKRMETSSQEIAKEQK